jgi:hypothetical protein
MTSDTNVAGKSTRKKMRTEGRRKRLEKLKNDAPFAKAYFEAKSKRSIEKKSSFRRKKIRKANKR